MRYATRREGSASVLSIDGRMDAEFLDALRALLPETRRVVVDLGRARGLVGDDLERLVQGHHLCHQEGGRFVLAAIPPDLSHILALMELDLFFTIYPTVEEAIERLEGGAPRRGASTRRIVAKETDRLARIEGLAGVVDPEEVARRRVERVKVTIRYLAPDADRIELLRVLAAARGPIDPAAVAGEGGFDPAWLGGALDRLEGVRVLDRDDQERLVYDPAAPARASIEDIIRMWEDPENRERMLAWGRA